MSQSLAQAIANIEEEAALKLVEEQLRAGVDPYAIIEECRQGMDEVGERYKAGEYFLSELIMSSEIFKAAMARLQPLIKVARQNRWLGKVVIGTPRGDIHDIGKNIVATLLEMSGFQVFDLGVDVAPQAFMDKIRETGATILGMSALITPSFGPMKEMVELLVKEGLRHRVKVIIGGGVTTEIVREYVGADAQTTDAMEGIEICRKFVTEEAQQ